MTKHAVPRGPLHRPQSIAVPGSGEYRVGQAVVAQLLALGYPAEAIGYEVKLGPGARVDIAAVGPGYALLVECKQYLAHPNHLPQCRRYLEAARAKWPGHRVSLVLAAPRVDVRLQAMALAPDIIVVAVAA